MVTEVLTEPRLAELKWSLEGILIIRFRSGSSMDLAGIQEVVDHRLRICNGQPAAVLVVLPADMDADIKVSVTDHGPGVKDLTIAEATVAQSVPHRKLADLYYSHFPQPFPTAVFALEEGAIAWLEAQKNAFA